MDKLRTMAAAAAFVAAASGVSYAQSQPSAKFTAQVGNINVLDSTALGWTTVLSNSIKTSSQKDLVVGVSLEAGLYTQTVVRSKTGTSDTSSAESSIQVRVLVDGKVAYPGEVVFARRKQAMTATFQGIIDGCLTVDSLGNVIINQDCVRPEELETLLDTMDANAFTFLLDDVGTGVHRVEVQARIESATSSQTGSATAKASIGKGSMTVEEVRMIKGEDIQL